MITEAVEHWKRGYATKEFVFVFNFNANSHMGSGYHIRRSGIEHAKQNNVPFKNRI